MLKNKTITIIGLGMIGGSIAKAYKKYLNAEKIFAVDISEQTREISVQEGIITETFENIFNNKVLFSDIIVLATPVNHAIEYLKKLAGKIKPDCIITDVCSTKDSLIQCIDKMDNPPIFIGGHPMAGLEKCGYTQSTSDLFIGSTFLITRSKTTNEDTFSTLLNIIEGIGAVPVELNSKEHDEATACISHLPHIVAFTLVNLIRQKDNNEVLKKLASGGFKDITRIASSDAKMWESILVSNKVPINNILTAYINEIEILRNWILNNNSEQILNFINNSKLYRNSIPDQKKLPCNP